MKIIGCAIIGAVALLFASAIHSLAIEGIKISVQSSNVVLSWPSVTNETYLAQYRPALNSTSSWQTLTNYFLARAGTNLTTFSSARSNNIGFYRVVRNGVHVFGLTNGMVLSGEVQLPIEFVLASTDTIAGVTFYAYDSPLTGASAETNAAGAWVLNWNTTMMPNGNYDLGTEVDFVTDDPATNFPVMVTVSNAISFPNYFTRIFGNQMWIYAESTMPNANCYVDMYDESSNYLGTFYVSTDSNGVVSFLWDLTDGNGHTFDSTNFYGVFTISTGSSGAVRSNLLTKSVNSPVPQKLSRRAVNGGAQPNAGSSSASATQTWASESAWQVGNSWAIAWSPLNVNDPVTTFRISEMMIGGEGGLYGGVVSALGYYGLGAQMSPGNVSQSSAFEMADADTRAEFLGYMAESQYRHFYFFGHGSPYAFGTPGAVITYTDAQHALHNFLNTRLPANYHPYRLVFIDGCQAGKASLCEVFGIPAQTLNNQFFRNTHVQSRAYLGFTKNTSFNWSQWDWRALMLGFFFEDWYTPGTQLRTCVSNAVNGVHENVVNMDSSWVIYGAPDLTKDTDTTQ